MTPARRNSLVALVSAAAAVLVALGVYFTVDIATDESGKPHVVIVFGTPLGPQGQDAYAEVRKEGLDDDAVGHADLENEAPPGSPIYADPEKRAEAILDSQAAAEKGTTGPNEVADPRTLAEPEQPGCRSGPFVDNFSSRNGTRPAMLVAHLTVSHNSAGWGDVDAIRAWFNNPRSQASSNYVIDAEGHCRYIVNEAFKAWTQGFFNGWSISIEFVHFSTTDPSEKWTDAQISKGAHVFADASRRWGIPVRLVDPSGCDVRAGITDHDRLECGNAHTDVGPRFPMNRFVRLIAEYKQPLRSCSATHVKQRLNSHATHWSHPPQPKLSIGKNFGARPRAEIVRLKKTHGFTSTSSTVSAAVGRVLRLSGCDGSLGVAPG